MYTAKSTKKEVKNGALYVTVEFTNGTDTFEKEFWANSGVDPDWLTNRVANQLIELNSLAVLADNMTLGTFDGKHKLASPTEGALWAQDVIKLKQMKASIDMGLIDNADPDFISQKKKVKDTFKKEFINSVQLF